ncbi:MAG: hypothetical protein H6629_17365 [Calditrichae bacterium]|nr:hypothetical protein [Calditrichia bacterium]
MVVFVDDLDRCFPEQAVRLLESIKLVLHQPRFAFVLGIYPQIIEEFIRNKYAAQYPMQTPGQRRWMIKTCTGGLTNIWTISTIISGKLYRSGTSFRSDNRPKCTTILNTCWMTPACSINS